MSFDEIMDERAADVSANISLPVAKQKLSKMAIKAIRFSTYSLSRAQNLKLIERGLNYLNKYEDVRKLSEIEFEPLPKLPSDIVATLESAAQILQAEGDKAGKNPQFARDKLCSELCGFASAVFDYPIITTAKREYKGPSAKVLTFIQDVFSEVRARGLSDIDRYSDSYIRANLFWADVADSTVAGWIQTVQSARGFGDDALLGFEQVANSLKHELAVKP